MMVFISDVAVKDHRYIFWKRSLSASRISTVSWVFWNCFIL